MDPLQEKITTVFRDVFDDPALEVHPGLSSSTFADWDSFAQVKLVIGLSEEFGVQFSTDDVLAASSVAAWRELIAAKLAAS
jgi:acyl carrier protein